MLGKANSKELIANFSPLLREINLRGLKTRNVLIATKFFKLDEAINKPAVDETTITKSIDKRYHYLIYSNYLKDKNLFH